MNIGGGNFKTGYSMDGSSNFTIEIKEESDLSLDGGYNFEEVTNTACLNEQECKQLILELSQYIKVAKSYVPLDFDAEPPF